MKEKILSLRAILINFRISLNGFNKPQIKHAKSTSNHRVIVSGKNEWKFHASKPTQTKGMGSEWYFGFLSGFRLLAWPLFVWLKRAGTTIFIGKKKIMLCYYWDCKVSGFCNLLILQRLEAPFVIARPHFPWDSGQKWLNNQLVRNVTINQTFIILGCRCECVDIREKLHFHII